MATPSAPPNRLVAAAPAQPASCDAGPALADVGPTWSAQIPSASQQIVVVSGTARSAATATSYRRSSDLGWVQVARWDAIIGAAGWTSHHQAGDLRTPIGVFTLSDAGGHEPDPGSGLPYSQSPNFLAGGQGLDGESLAGAFDYVVAIDYNRVAGRSPLDRSKPLGVKRGGGIWFHVEHGGPTHGCVSLSRAAMINLIRALKSTEHPVVLMGPAAELAQ